MKVGIDGRIFAAKNPGGAVQVGNEIASRLPNLTDETVIFGHKSQSNQYSNVQFVSDLFFTRNPVYSIIWEQTFLPRLTYKYSVDILLCPNTYCPLREIDSKIAIIVSDIPEYYGYVTGKYEKFRKFMVPKVTDKADIIIVPSKFLKYALHNQVGVPLEKIAVIPNGIKESYIEQDRPNVDVDLPENYILFVGALSKRKNVDGAIRAFKKAQSFCNIPHELVIVGDSTNPAIDKADISSENDIHLLGYVSDEILRYCYHKADAFVFPSYHESFGLPPLEAMAFETPVIASNRTAIPEVSGEGAHLVDPE
ncbi:MAG: glycosyltransferase family 4 protein, partial [Candidatus Paceibacteria bacterium]